MSEVLGHLRRAAATRVMRLAPVDDLPAGRMVTLPGRGRTLVHDVAGPGGAPTLILLHGLACTALLTWYPAFAPLARQFRVVAFDQRWHGRGITSDSFRLADCADDVAAVADALRIDGAIVVGHSMGSLVAQLAWHRHPELVEGLVLATPTDHFRTTSRARIFHDLTTRTSAVLRPLARTQAAHRSAALAPPARHVGDVLDPHSWALGQLRTTSTWAIGQALAAIGRFDSSQWVDGVDVPTSVVVTTRDRLIGPEHQRRVAHRINGSAVFEADAGHVSCVADAEAFLPALLAACSSVACRLPQAA